MRPAVRGALAALVIVLSGAAAFGAAEPDNRWLRWENHREAQERSRSEDKPLMVYFNEPGDKWCNKMEKETFADLRVKSYLNEHFAMTTIVAGEQSALAQKYEVAGLPTIWFVSAKGRRLTRLDGFVAKEDFLPLLEFIVTKAYTTSDFETWLDEKR